jgi:hypothetical protein
MVISPVYDAVVVISVNCETGVKLAGTGFGLVLLVVAVVVPPDVVVPVTVVPPLGATV